MEYKNDPEKYITSGFRYNDSTSADEFKSKVLLFLKDDVSSPAYIFDEGVFGEVSKINIPIYRAKGHAAVEYSRQIGVDYTESWVETKTIKYSDGTRKVTSTPHTKTRTEWNYDSGLLEGDAFSQCYDEQYSPFAEYLSLDDKEKKITELTRDELDKIEIKPHIISYLKNNILENVFANNITYPGHHVKNEEHSGTVRLLDTFVIIISIYVMEIKIRDKEVYFYANTNGEFNMKIVGEFPNDDDLDEFFTESRKLAQARREELRKPKRFYHTSNLLGFLGFVLLLVLGLVFNIIVMSILSFVPIVVGFIVGFKSMKEARKIDKKHRQIAIKHTTERYNKHQNQKDEGYNRIINNK